MSRPTGVFKLRNDYCDSAQDYDKTPKAVWCALAVSLAMRLSEDYPERADALLREEWDRLYRAGLVPQKPLSQARGERDGVHCKCGNVVGADGVRCVECAPERGAK